MKKPFVPYAYSTSIAALLLAMSALSACTTIFGDEREGTMVNGPRHVPILNQQYIRNAAPIVPQAPANDPYSLYNPNQPMGTSAPNAMTPFDSYDSEGNRVFAPSKKDDSSVGMADSVVDFLTGEETTPKPAAKQASKTSGRKPLPGNIAVDTSTQDSYPVTGVSSSSSGGYYSEPQYIAMPLGTPPVAEGGARVPSNAPVNVPLGFDSGVAPVSSEPALYEPVKAEPAEPASIPALKPLTQDSGQHEGVYIAPATPVAEARPVHPAYEQALTPVEPAEAMPTRTAAEEAAIERAYQEAWGDAEPKPAKAPAAANAQEPSFMERVFGSFNDEQPQPQPAPAPVTQKRIEQAPTAATGDAEFPSLTSVPQRSKSFNDVLSERSARMQGMEASRDVAQQQKQALDAEPSELAVPVQPAPAAQMAAPVVLNEPADDEESADLPAPGVLKQVRPTQSTYGY